MTRRIAGAVMLILGIWLIYGAITPIQAYMSRGGDLASALFEPPTGILRLTGSAFMVIGGLMTALASRASGTVSMIGAVIFLLLGGLMAITGAHSSLWMQEVLYGLGAVALAVLILILHRD